VRQRSRQEQQRGLIRVIIKTDRRLVYEKKRLLHLTREPVARTVEAMSADPICTFHDQVEMEEQARLLRYRILTMDVGE